MKKIIRIIKQDGIIGLFKRVLKKAFTKNRKDIKDIKYLKKILNGNYDKIIVFENNFGWTQIMKQRPQQIASNFNKKVLMIYGTPYNEFKNINRIDKINSNLFLVDLNVYRKDLIKILNNYDNKYLLIYSTDFVEEYIINKYLNSRYKLIYDYVDNIDKALCNPVYYELLLKRQNKVLNSNYSIIISTSTELQKKALQINKNANIALISNGVDYNHFHKKHYSTIKKMEDIKSENKIIIGYYGALASWFDYNLVKKISQNEKYIIVIIGLDFDNTIEKSKILEINNIRYLGRIEYDNLADYANYFDVCIIPFLINDITKATNPVKLFEYMALEKPIVTTNLNECYKYKSVLISKNEKEFISNIEEALKLSNNKEYIKLLNKEAKENSWKNKCQEFIDFIDLTKDKVEYLPQQNRVISFTIKVFKYLKWHLIDKNKMYIKTYVKKVFDLKTKKKYQKQIEKILTEHQNCEKIILWISSNFGWNVGLFQRPQHIARNMARSNVLYLYDAPNDYDKVETIKKIENNLYLVNTNNKLFFDILIKALKESKKQKYIHIYSTEIGLSLKKLKKFERKKFKILYEYIDDLSPIIAGTEELPKNILEKNQYCLRNVKNVGVVVTADNIEKDVLRYRPKETFVYSCNGVDYSHFQVKPDISKVNLKMKKIIDSKKPIIGYYGALASWFDYEMLKYLAKQRPNYNIVLIGVKYDKHYNYHNLEKIQNIHYLGTINYEELPNYAVYFDVCTIPFLINEITQATSPLKLFEYMALHKPIITTAMHECKKYKSVFIAENQKHFVELIDKCILLENNKDNEYFKLLDEEAKNNTWEEKTKIILKYLNKF